jgi:hypothetical protein
MSLNYTDPVGYNGIIVIQIFKPQRILHLSEENV